MGAARGPRHRGACAAARRSAPHRPRRVRGGADPRSDARRRAGRRSARAPRRVPLAPGERRGDQRAAAGAGAGGAGGGGARGSCRSFSLAPAAVRRSPRAVRRSIPTRAGCSVRVVQLVRLPSPCRPPRTPPCCSCGRVDWPLPTRRSPPTAPAAPPTRARSPRPARTPRARSRSSSSTISGTPCAARPSSFRSTRLSSGTSRRGRNRRRAASPPPACTRWDRRCPSDRWGSRRRRCRRRRSSPAA